MTPTQLAADLLVSQHQVRRLMAMRRHFLRYQPPPTLEFWDGWACAMAAQMDHVDLLQSALAATGRAANDARVEVPA